MIDFEAQREERILAVYFFLEYFCIPIRTEELVTCLLTYFIWISVYGAISSHSTVKS